MKIIKNQKSKIAFCVKLFFATFFVIKLSIVSGFSQAASENDGELLYNGIRLPSVWPPQNVPKDRSVKPVPYLENIPERLPVNVGRQLFVDDFLIESTTLERRFHYPKKYEGNPILKPETPLELNGGEQTCATVFSDGIVWDPKDKIFKMWYHAGWFDGTAYAFSQDGINWTRPNLNVVAGTNRVLPYYQGSRRRDGASMFIDHNETNPNKRFKMFIYERPSDTYGGQVLTSPDGINWTFVSRTSDVGDCTSIHYNPFRGKWVYSVRTSTSGNRTRGYREHVDLLEGAQWNRDELVHWASLDEKDLPDPWVLALMPNRDRLEKMAEETDDPSVLLNRHVPRNYGDPPQLYNLEAAPYESLMIGVFQVHYGPLNAICNELKMPKFTDLQITYSRDGFHWHRPDRTPFIAATRKKGDWDFAYLHSASTVCAVFEDRIVFYYGGWSGESPNRGTDMYSGGATGIATLRRDGFASMSAASGAGNLTTRPVVFEGKYPFVNVDTDGGTLTVEILDEQGNVIPGFSRNEFTPIRGNHVKQAMTWRGAPNLATLINKPVRFRFYLDKGDLFAFWVSPDANGASQGYVAAGSPDYSGPVDK